MINRTTIINDLIKKFNYKSYLEIGVERGLNFSEIECDLKIGVDPDRSTMADCHMDSDTFFKINGREWDLIFIDGLHTAKQVLDDINDSLMTLSPRGSIVVHDCNPRSKEIQEGEPRPVNWTGDVWKSWSRYVLYSDYETFTVDTDYGVGILFKPNWSVKGPKDDDRALTYENLEANRKKWLNLITVEEYQQWISQQ